MSAFPRICCFLPVILSFLLLTACGSEESGSRVSGPDTPVSPAPDNNTVTATGLPEVDESQRTINSNERIYNTEASIPSQCYTKTEGEFNPCYTCHQIYEDNDRSNHLMDGFLQGDYGFSEIGITNHWTNLFVDRRDWLSTVSDDTIVSYVNSDNYSDLALRLRESDWNGFIPDLNNYQNAAAAFDDKGLALDGSGWVAFNYKPFPGTFWPTNGSTDDVVLRLPEMFGQINGENNRDIYYINLSLTEMTITGLNQITLWPIDESLIGADLDQDGVLGVTDLIKQRSHYIGDASGVALVTGQFPVGSELMHSVRYVGSDTEGNIFPSVRMKELRYMRKVNTLSEAQLESRYDNERKEKFLGELPYFLNKHDQGYDNALGWFVQGFIEDYDGSLRPQTLEEGLFCMGCHSAIGTTIDSTFSMARKVPGGAGWGYLNLKNMPDVPSRSSMTAGVLEYLQRVGGGSEFRENPEMHEKWFHTDGTILEEKVLSADMYELTTPSRRRALDLNKAYSHIVRHQSFRFGRDATWIPAENVIRGVTAHDIPLDEENRYFGWDIRPDWNR